MATDILERGDIYFAYRPRVEQEEAQDVDDIQRLYLILQPAGGQRTRRLVLGRKRLPDPDEHQRHWGFVDEVADRPEPVLDDLQRETYETKTRGERILPEARPAGEGRYAIVRHDDHTHFAYELELPDERGQPQEDLGIEPEASYIAAVKNPEAPTPPGVGLQPSAQADLPRRLQERFEGRRFADAEPDLFDHEGVEFVLIGATEDAESELGVKIDAEWESADSADMFRRLKMPPGEQPTEPLTEGEWR